MGLDPGDEVITGGGGDEDGGSEATTGGSEATTGGGGDEDGGSEATTGGSEATTGGPDPTTGGPDPTTGGPDTTPPEGGGIGEVSKLFIVACIFIPLLLVGGFSVLYVLCTDNQSRGRATKDSSKKESKKLLATLASKNSASAKRKSIVVGAVQCPVQKGKQ